MPQAAHTLSQRWPPVCVIKQCQGAVQWRRGGTQNKVGAAQEASVHWFEEAEFMAAEFCMFPECLHPLPLEHA